MKIISFSWTSPAILALAKTVTRRDWKLRHAESFKKDEIVQAWDKSPRFKGKKIGIIRLLREPYLESTCKMPMTDYVYEGFEYLDEHPELISPAAKRAGFKPPLITAFEHWKSAGEMLYVVRFEIVELEG